QTPSRTRRLSLHHVATSNRSAIRDGQRPITRVPDCETEERRKERVPRKPMQARIDVQPMWTHERNTKWPNSFSNTSAMSFFTAFKSVLGARAGRPRKKRARYLRMPWVPMAQPTGERWT